MSNYLDINQIKKAPLQPPMMVSAPPALEHLTHQLAGEAVVAVDTESNSLFVYFEQTCLIQISTSATDYLVDSLVLSKDLQPLAPFFADPAIEKVIHAAEYDLLCLKRDFQFSFNHLFDTMIAARILGWKNVGLGSILQERFGVTLNKKMQRADWGHRPLSPEHIAYAREDTHYLLALRDLQIKELQQAGRLDEAREEFERLTHIEAAPRTFDPDAYARITEARKLDSAALGVLRELFRFRDTQARKENRPPFKVLTDQMMLRIADAKPTSNQTLAKNTSDYTMRHYAASILAAVERGMRTPQLKLPRPRARNGTPLDNHAQDRLTKLRDWRKARAEKRGVMSDVIISNDALIAIARENPATLEELVQAGELGEWRAREYGEEMLAVLPKRKKQKGTE